MPFSIHIEVDPKAGVAVILLGDKQTLGTGAHMNLHAMWMLVCSTTNDDSWVLTKNEGFHRFEFKKS